MKNKIFPIILIQVLLLLGCQKEKINSEQDVENDLETYSEELSYLSSMNRILALSDYKITTAKTISSSNEVKTDKNIENLIDYCLNNNFKHLTPSKEIINYTIKKDYRYKYNINASSKSYENDIAVLRLQTILKLWRQTSKQSIYEIIKEYVQKRSIIFDNGLSADKEIDKIVSIPSWALKNKNKNIKVFKVTLILPWATSIIECREDQYILDAAEENGISLPYNSRAGADGSTASLLLSGKVDQSDQSFLDDDQISMGFVLIDVAYPQSDCTLKTHMEDMLCKTYPSISMWGKIDEITIEGYRPNTTTDNTTPKVIPDPFDPYSHEGIFNNLNTFIAFSPCRMAQTIVTITKIPNYITEMMNYAKYSKNEKARIVDNKGRIYEFNELNESCQVDIKTDKYILSIIHTHPNNCGSIFSAGDIRLMWIYFSNGQIDCNSFSYGVANSHDEIYFLCIADPKRFNEFARRWNLDSSSESLKKHFERIFQNRDLWNGSTTEIESLFLSFLDNAGLMLYKRVNDDDYDPLTNDIMGNPISIKC